MKDMKRMEILLKVIERIYSNIPGMQTMTNESMKNICKEEALSHKQVFFSLLFALLLWTI